MTKTVKRNVPSPEERLLIERIAKRFVRMAAVHGKSFIERDLITRISLCHSVACPLDLNGLADATELNVAHDVCEILRHFDVPTLSVPAWFEPRYAKSAQGIE